MGSAYLSIALLIFGTHAFSQEHPTVAAQANTVYVGADGKSEATPDTAQIQFNVSAQDDTSQKAFQRASKDVEQVRQVLGANGIETRAATIGFFSVQPVYDWSNAKQKVVSYRVTTDVISSPQRLGGQAGHLGCKLKPNPWLAFRTQRRSYPLCEPPMRPRRSCAH